MHKKLVSVIMSTYNTKKDYLLLSVDSILRQTYNNIELIVVIDGGEYDDCLSEIDDKRLRIIRHKDSLGLAARLNEAISLARGDYVARMDSDDYALPDRLGRQVDFMEKNHAVDICSTFARKFGESDEVMINPDVDNDYIRARLFTNNIIIHPTVMFRMSSIKKKNIKYNQKFRYSQDFELWSRLSNNCHFAIIPEIALLYRVHNKQVSGSRSKEQKAFYHEALLANLQTLGLSDNDVRFVDILNQRLPLTNVKELQAFIGECILHNNEFLFYDKKVFKNVLFRSMFVYFSKQHMPFLALRYFRWYAMSFALRKNLLKLRFRFRDRRIKKEYSAIINDNKEMI